MLPFQKPPLDYDAQADLLFQRGFQGDRAVVLKRLRAVGYYRLCAYWHPFKQPDDSFAPGTSIELVWRRYMFDRRLRLLVMDAIERIEVAVRCSMIDTIAVRHGSFAHLDRRNVPGAKRNEHSELVCKLQREAEKSSEDFVRHFRSTYRQFPDLPMWAAGQLMSFGSIVKLLSWTENKIQKELGRRYALPRPVFMSWLLTLNYVRNVCAHHNRLWNRELGVKPELPTAKTDNRWHDPSAIGNDRLFVLLLILRRMLHHIAPGSGWHERTTHLFDDFSDIPLGRMGLPADWRQQALWVSPV